MELLQSCIKPPISFSIISIYCISWKHPFLGNGNFVLLITAKYFRCTTFCAAYVCTNIHDLVDNVLKTRVEQSVLGKAWILCTDVYKWLSLFSPYCSGSFTVMLVGRISHWECYICSLVCIEHLEVQDCPVVCGGWWSWTLCDLRFGCCEFINYSFYMYDNGACRHGNRGRFPRQVPHHFTSWLFLWW